MKDLSVFLCLLGCMLHFHVSQAGTEFEVTIENGFKAEKVFSHKVSRRQASGSTDGQVQGSTAQVLKAQKRIKKDVVIHVGYKANAIQVRLRRGVKVEPLQVQVVPSSPQQHMHLRVSHRARRAAVDIVHKQKLDLTCDLPDGRKIPSGQNFKYTYEGLRFLCHCPDNRKDLMQKTVEVDCVLDEGAENGSDCLLADGTVVTNGLSFQTTYHGERYTCLCNKTIKAGKVPCVKDSDHSGNPVDVGEIIDLFNDLFNSLLGGGNYGNTVGYGGYNNGKGNPSNHAGNPYYNYQKLPRRPKHCAQKEIGRLNNGGCHLYTGEVVPEGQTFTHVQDGTNYKCTCPKSNNNEGSIKIHCYKEGEDIGAYCKTLDGQKIPAGNSFEVEWYGSKETCMCPHLEDAVHNHLGQIIVNCTFDHSTTGQSGTKYQGCTLPGGRLVEAGKTIQHYENGVLYNCTCPDNTTSSESMVDMPCNATGGYLDQKPTCQLQDGRSIPAGQKFLMNVKGRVRICVCPARASESQIICTDKGSVDHTGAKEHAECRLPDGRVISLGQTVISKAGGVVCTCQLGESGKPQVLCQSSDIYEKTKMGITELGEAGCVLPNGQTVSPGAKFEYFYNREPVICYCPEKVSATKELKVKCQTPE